MDDLVPQNRCATCQKQAPAQKVCRTVCHWTFIQSSGTTCRGGSYESCEWVTQPIVEGPCNCFHGAATLPDHDVVETRLENASNPSTIELVVELSWNVTSWKGVRLAGPSVGVENPHAGARPNTPYPRSPVLVVRATDLVDGNFVVLAKQTLFEHTPMYRIPAKDLAPLVGKRVVFHWEWDN
jgi:hypothetical protein